MTNQTKKFKFKQVKKSTKYMEQLCKQLAPGWELEDLERIADRMTPEDINAGMEIEKMFHAMSRSKREAKNSMGDFISGQTADTYGAVKYIMEKQISPAEELEQRGKCITGLQNIRKLRGEDVFHDGEVIKALGTKPLDELKEETAKELETVWKEYGTKALNHTAAVLASQEDEEYAFLNEWFYEQGLEADDYRVSMLLGTAVWLECCENSKKPEYFKNSENENERAVWEALKEHPELIGSAMGAASEAMPYLLEEFYAYEKEHKKERRKEMLSKICLLLVGILMTAMGGWLTAIMLESAPEILGIADEIAAGGNFIIMAMCALYYVIGYAGGIFMGATIAVVGGYCVITEVWDVIQTLRTEDTMERYFACLETKEKEQKKQTAEQTNQQMGNGCSEEDLEEESEDETSKQEDFEDR